MTHEDVRTKLMKRRDELLGQIGKIESDIRHVKDPLEQDSQERSVQTENDEVLDALDDAGRREIASIVSALGRIDDGTYGTCTSCEEPIPQSRLEAVPAAERCLRCAETVE